MNQTMSRQLDPDLHGAIDMHVHSAPDLAPRKFDDFELARQAAAQGMRALIIKSHWVSTVERAHLAQQTAPGTRVFGGLALNHTVGGFNPAAVEVALRMGAAEIWMPTLSSRAEPKPYFGGGLSIFDGDCLDKRVVDIVQLIADHDAILGTGHLPPAEIMALVPAAYKLGIRKILITHPEHPPVEMPVGQQEELRDRYSVFFERCLISTTHGGGKLTFGQMAQAIRQVGPETTIIATDFGQTENLAPTEGLALFMRLLREHGFDRDSIIRMSHHNPAQVLGIQ
jgi:hypothetical protein